MTHMILVSFRADNLRNFNVGNIDKNIENTRGNPRALLSVRCPNFVNYEMLK